MLGVAKRLRQQLTLDLDADMPENRVCLMEAMDEVNQRYGRGTLVAGQRCSPRGRKLWAMKQERMSSRYKTDWDRLSVGS